MTEYRESHRKAREWAGLGLEILKWIFVLWLLWPLRHPSGTPLEFFRVIAGIVLFIIFSGKLLYDTVIMSIIHQRRKTAKQDFITLIGLVLAMGLVVGVLFLFVGYAFLELYRASSRHESEE